MSQTRKERIEDYRKTNLYLKSGYDNPRYGKTYEEIYGNDISRNVKQKLSVCRRGKTYEELFGKEKAKELKDRASKRNTGEKNPCYKKTPSSETIQKKSIKCEFIDPAGNKYYPDSFTGFCKDKELDKRTMFKVRKGKQSYHHGWTCREL